MLRRWVAGGVVLGSLLLGAGLTQSGFAALMPYGLPVKGLKGSIAASREVYQGAQSIDVVLTLTNVSDQPIRIDPWEGNWFVQVHDEAWLLQPVVRAMDVTRAAPEPRTLRPGERWSVSVQGLRLLAGLPGSTPLWEYRRLKPGRYMVGAEFTSTSTPTRPHLWSGTLSCKPVEIQIAGN